MNAALTLYDLRKRHGQQLLFDIPRLVIERGSCSVLTGPNGTGKSTLLRVIAGLEPPDSGDIAYRGRRAPWRRARRYFAGEVIYLHQEPYMFDASVADNVAYGLRRRRLPAAQIGQRVAAALRWASLDHLANRPARALSGGERQRVALVRAWVLEPNVLLLDEPMASLDQAARQQTCNLIARLRRDAVTMVVISHDAQQLSAVASDHLHLQDGHLRVLHPRPTAAGAEVVMLDLHRRNPPTAAARGQENA